jgi:hypothetical protein
MRVSITEAFRRMVWTNDGRSRLAEVVRFTFPLSFLLVGQTPIRLCLKI